VLAFTEALCGPGSADPVMYEKLIEDGLVVSVTACAMVEVPDAQAIKKGISQMRPEVELSTEDLSAGIHETRPMLNTAV
jgi:hypothetical protein